MIRKIHHIAIVVPDLREAEKQYRSALSLGFDRVMKMPEYNVEIGFMSVGDILLEFISPTGEEDRFTPFLRQHGGGIHHMAYEVGDINTAMEKVRAAGVEPENREPIRGADGLICFIGSQHLGGVLTELVQVSET